MADTLSEAGSAKRPTSDNSARGGGFRLPVWLWLTLWMVVVVGGAVAAHYAVHGVVNGLQFSIAFFLAINIMICWWEISLGARISDIEYWNHDPEGRKQRPRGGVFVARASLRDLCSTLLWARVWSEYSYYDGSYANRRSYGFWADVGNGWNTLLPSIFFLVGMTVGVVPPVVLGIVGLIIFYQKFYCTTLYFIAYVFNRRYAGRPMAWVIAIVGGTNGIWIVFPGIALYACLRLILDNSYAVLWF